MALISAAMSFVALRECSANLRTSSATTAKPRPASPARAASMAALSASKFVCSVMSLITLIISEISSERSPSDLIFFAVACTEARIRCIPSSVSRTARLPCSAASRARRAASALASALFETCFIETVNSSTADEVLVISWSCWVAPAVMSSAASRIWFAPVLTSMAALRTRSRTLVKLSSMKFTESTTLPSASLVTFPRIVRSPRATWLIVLSRSVMLRCRESWACWFVTACATFAALRFRFSAISPNSSPLSNSARARASPATSRSENFASSPTGFSTRLPSTNISSKAAAIARPNAANRGPLALEGSDGASAIAMPPDSLPAWYASPSTANNDTAVPATSIQIVELNRDFMTSSQNVCALLPEKPIPKTADPKLPNAKSNHRFWKHFRHAPQVDHQRQSILMPQHSAAVRHLRRRLIEQSVFGGGKRSDHLVRRDPHAQIVALRVALDRRHHHMLRQQPRTAAFGEGDIHQRDNGAAQIEDAHQIRGRERNPRHDRPVDHFLQFQ